MNSCTNLDDAKTTYQLETELDAAKKEIEALKDEVQKLQSKKLIFVFLSTK